MCHPSLGLHGKKSSKKQQKQAKSKPVKKAKAIKQEEPCEAQLFFLENEDVLY